MNTYIIDQHNSTLHWEEEFQNSANHVDVEVEGGKIFTELGKITGGFAEMDFSNFLPKEKQVEDEKEFNFGKFLKKDDIIKGKNLEEVEFKIEQVLVKPNKQEVRGLLKINNRAFSFSFPAKIDIGEKRITVDGEFHMGEINPEWKSEIKEIEANDLKDIKLRFKLIANSQQL